MWCAESVIHSYLNCLHNIDVFKDILLYSNTIATDMKVSDDEKDFTCNKGP